MGTPARSHRVVLATRDFSVFHDLVQELKARGMPYSLADPGKPLNPRVRAVVTSSAEVALVGPQAEAVGASLVVFTDPGRTAGALVQALAGKRRFARVVVGIDPGERPGVAVIGDGVLLSTARAATPEAVAEEVERTVGSVEADGYLVRVGHGAPTQRDRILRAIAALGHDELRVEIVDETRSTPLTAKSPHERDTTAAAAIALERGAPVWTAPEPRPSEGEVRDIQRKSRLASEGQLTISRELAHAVAVGDLTLDEAVHAQRGKRLAT